MRGKIAKRLRRMARELRPSIKQVMKDGSVRWNGRVRAYKELKRGWKSGLR